MITSTLPVSTHVELDMYQNRGEVWLRQLSNPALVETTPEETSVNDTDAPGGFAVDPAGALTVAGAGQGCRG